MKRNKSTRLVMRMNCRRRKSNLPCSRSGWKYFFGESIRPVYFPANNTISIFSPRSELGAFFHQVLYICSRSGSNIVQPLENYTFLTHFKSSFCLLCVATNHSIGESKAPLTFPAGHFSSAFRQHLIHFRCTFLTTFLYGCEWLFSCAMYVLCVEQIWACLWSDINENTAPVV